MYIKRFKSGIVGCKIMDEQQISGYIMAAGGFVMVGKLQKSPHIFSLYSERKGNLSGNSNLL
jgi:hypothetical protein